ncbi:Gfo/Idh/MocA family oxidoreductase [Arthrobacter sp. GN70]|nr:Gfo/Idh/MocA family oxidoreductase [Arthrobacter sp. GN70]
MATLRNALKALSTTLDLPFDIKLAALGGRSPERTEKAAKQWGFESYTTDWRRLVDNPQVHVLVNLTGNSMHAEPSIAALQLGKHVLCEKPLATSNADVAAMVDAARSSTGINACGYNYRFVPAVRLAKQLVSSGRLGPLRDVNIAYEQDWASKLPARQGWRFDNPVEGSAVYDLSHIIDLFRWIVDEPDAVTATVGSLRPVSENTGVSDAIIGADPEDSYTALVRTDGGLLATFRASRIATGRKGRQRLEITGEHGSLVWNMEDLNRLQVFIEDQDNTISGYRDVLVTEMDHPFMNYWFAPGHIIGWDHTVIHQWISVLAGITQFDPSIPADFATFEDGARAVSVADSIRQSAREQRWIKVGASQSVRA